MYTPYPFERLPKLSHAQVHALAGLHALFTDAKVETALRCAETLLGAKMSCTLGMPEPCSHDGGSTRTTGAPAVWVQLEPKAASPECSVWLELPIGFAEHLAECMLGGASELGAPPTGTALDELSLGAIAYLVARLCGACGSRLVLREITGAAPRQDSPRVSFGATFRSGEADASIRAYVPARLLRDAHATRSPVQRYGAIPLALWADAGTACLDLATLRSLGRGDVIVLSRSDMWFARDAEFRGLARVRVEGSTTALVCRADRDRLEVEAIECTPEPSMTAGRRIESPGAERALARDAPIELAVEIARFRVRLDELERLAPGDVLVTGRRIGERVTLRAAGVAVAEGELVDVEGELGIRILRLLDHGPIV